MGKKQFFFNNASLKSTLLFTLLCKSKFSLAMCCAAGYMYVTRNSWYLTYAKRVRLSIFLPFWLSHIHFNRSWWIIFAHPVDARLNVLMKTILLWILPFPSEFIVMLSCVAEFIAMLLSCLYSLNTANKHFDRLLSISWYGWTHGLCIRGRAVLCTNKHNHLVNEF